MAITQVSNSLVKQDLTISGGTVDNTVIGSGTPAAGTFTTVAGTLASTVTGTTQAASDNSTKIATTAYVTTALANLVDSAPGTLNTLNELAAALGDDASFSTTVTNSIATKLPLAGGTLSGLLTAAAKIKLTDTGNATVAALQLTDAGLGISSPTTDQMNFITADTTRMVITNAGSIGIGKTPPTDSHSSWSQLFIGEKGSLISERLGSSGYYGTLLSDNLYLDADTGAFANITTDESTLYSQEAGAHRWYSQGSGTAGAAVTLSQKMMIGSNGYVGVGTSVLNKIFNLADPAQGGETLKLHFEASSSNDKWAIYSYDRTNGHYADLSFGGNYLYLKSGGNVGIGTANPARPLTVEGSSIVARFGSSSIYHEFNSANGILNFVQASGALARFQVNGVDLLSLTGSKVGVGTTSPASLFHVDGAYSGGPVVTIHQTAGGSSADRGLDVETSSTGTTVQRWLNSGTELARVTGSGNVGIGTTSPGQKLHVNGQIQINSGYGLLFGGTTTQIYSNGNYIRARTGGADRFEILQGGGIVVNQPGNSNADFRVEGDTNDHMFLVACSSNAVRIGSNGGVSGTLEVHNQDNKHGITQTSTTTVAGINKPATYAEGVQAFDTSSLGTKLSIPITSQPNLWRQYTVELMFCNIEYNASSSAKGGFARFSFVSLTSLQGLSVMSTEGNVSSVTVSGMNVEVNFTSGYTGGLSNYEGLQCHYRVLAYTPEYFKIWDGTLN